MCFIKVVSEKLRDHRLPKGLAGMKRVMIVGFSAEYFGLFVIKRTALAFVCTKIIHL